MRKFYNFVEVINAFPEHDFAMATIIKVEGSSYRHKGAKMLFRQDGQRFGSISAGCLEEDLAYHADEVIKLKSSKTITYDLRAEEDSGWGQGAGCNGAITLLVEHVSSSFNQVWLSIQNSLKSGSRVACAKSLHSNTNSLMALDLDTGNLLNKQEDELFHLDLSTFKHLKEEQVVIYTSLNGQNKYLIEVYEPKENLFIFGAGPDVVPIVNITKNMDFNITIIDPRSGLNNKNNFPKADSLMVEHPKIFLDKFSIQTNSYVLVMTHNFNWDRLILSYLVQNRPLYLGVLGSTKRTARLLNGEFPAWIQSPVGLDIQAEGEEEIAVSIAAELVKYKNMEKTSYHMTLV